MARLVNPDFWRGRSVLVTGHTGFKGAWLSLRLQSMGAYLTGYADEVPTQPSLLELGRVGERMADVRGDIATTPPCSTRSPGTRPRSSSTWPRSRSCAARSSIRARRTRRT